LAGAIVKHETVLAPECGRSNRELSVDHSTPALRVITAPSTVRRKINLRNIFQISSNQERREAPSKTRNCQSRPPNDAVASRRHRHEKRPARSGKGVRAGAV
jgi:hypothetical protein